jgi:dTDP-4-dehydrorhamnose 3,5-epimerase
MTFEIVETSFKGLHLINRSQFQDFRGTFTNIFSSKEMSTILNSKNIEQVNFSRTTKKGTVRGMHFQLPPFAERKMITCVRGSVYDVAVDIRSDSPTFLQYFGTVLSCNNSKGLLIPEGFAHGFQTLTDEAELIYIHSAPYSSSQDAALNAIDPILNIKWPRRIKKISLRDRTAPYIDQYFKGFSLDEM